jgi:hypothetical protein
VNFKDKPCRGRIGAKGENAVAILKGRLKKPWQRVNGNGCERLFKPLEADSGALDRGDVFHVGGK